MARPIVPYMGGKRKLAKHILPYFKKHTCYVEPFAGGLALLFAKNPSTCEVVNDINKDIVCLYKVLQNHPKELERIFEYQISSRELFDEMLKQDISMLTDIQRAFRFIYLQKLCFAGHTEHRTFGTATTAKTRLNKKTLWKNIGEIHNRLERVQIENLDWKKVIDKYDRSHTLFYCDPPYWKSSGYGYSFPWSEYEALEKLINSIEGTMILSINDDPDIRKLFSKHKIIELKTSYTPGKERKFVNELLILSNDK